MRLTESRLRRIIRDIIAESMSKPDSYDKIVADQQAFRQNMADQEAYDADMARLDADVKMQEDIDTMMETLSVMSKSEIRDKVSDNAHLTGLAEDLKYDHNSLSALAAALVKSGISIF